MPAHKDCELFYPLAGLPTNSFLISFFLSWVANTQLNHWSKWVACTQLINLVGPKKLSRSVANLIYGRPASPSTAGGRR